MTRPYAAQRWLPTLLKELESAKAEMCYEAAGVCGELGEVAAVPHLIKLVNDPDVNARLAAIKAPGKIGGVKAKECLKKCLSSTDEVTQAAAEEALHQLQMEEDPLTVKVEPFEYWHPN